MVSKWINQFRKKYVYTDKVKLITNEWMIENALKYEEELMHKDTNIDSDNIPYVAGMQVKNASRECLIKEIIATSEYTTQKICVIMNPYGYAPLTALAVFKTDKPYSVKMWVNSSKRTTIKGELPAATEHRVPIIGLFAGRENQVNIDLYNGNARVKKIRFILKTDKLPEELAHMITIHERKGSSAYPFYYVSGVDTWYPYVFDEDGRIRMFIEKPSKNYGGFPISNGLILHSDRAILRPSYGVPHSTHVYEMDMFGRIRRTLLVKNGLHHDTVEMAPGGNYLIATSSLKGFCEDVVAELDRKTGKIVKCIEMNDIVTEASVKDSSDWAHMNTVAYCGRTNSVYVCLRNLHSVLKLDWETNELKWILGDPFFWKGTTMEKYVLKPEGDIKWFYQAHASFEMDAEDGDGDNIVRIGIYDNHCQSRRQTENFDNDPLSYGLVYIIDENSKTVKLHKSFESVKSAIRSNVVYSKIKDRFLVMSGCLGKKYTGSTGLIYDYEYSSGKLMRLYGTRKKFYRVYPYEFNYSSLAEPFEYDCEPYGEYAYEPQKIDAIDVSDAVTMPTELPAKDPGPKPKRKDMKTRKEKEEEWEKMLAGRKWEDLDHTELIARTSFRICDNVLYLHSVDHVVTNLYMVGKNYTYTIDYTDTEQELMAIFYNYGFQMAIPVNSMEQDEYHLYVKCYGVLYDTGKTFTTVRN